MVQLKVPFGTIVSFSALVSIPYGTIKRHIPPLHIFCHFLFQFLMVQLKDVFTPLPASVPRFQFLMVQLKDMQNKILTAPTMFQFLMVQLKAN